MKVHAFVLKILQREAGSSIEAVLPTLHKMAVNEDYPESLRGVLSALARQAENVPRRAKPKPCSNCCLESRAR